MAGYGGGYGYPSAGSGYGEYEDAPPSRHHGHREHGEHRPEYEESYEEPHRIAPHLQGKAMNIFCEANPSFSLTVRGDRPVLTPRKLNDPYQEWIKDDRWGSRVKDEAGFPAFALINKGSGLALRHGSEMNDMVELHRYDPSALDESVLWTQSADVGKGFQCIRPVGNIHLNLDAHKGTLEFGGVKDGNPLILFKWKKQENQKWKIVPIPTSDEESAHGYKPSEDHLRPGYGGYPPQEYQHHDYPEPHYPQHHHGGEYSEQVAPIRGKAVKLYCEARPDFFLTAREDGVVLAPGDDADIRQVWIKDESWSNKVKDEAGFPAFALIHKATQKALKHGKADFDEVELVPYNPGELDESVLWTQSADVGHGYKCIRPVNDIHLNLDASHGDAKYGGVHDGTRIILFKWRKHENQKWSMVQV